MTGHAQHPGSVRRACEQACDAGHGYTRDQVVDVERWAWAGEVIAGRAAFCFDGISFWRQYGISTTRAVAAGEAPRRGWWHGSTCTCTLCARACSSSLATATGTSGRGAVGRRLVAAALIERRSADGT